MLNLNIKNPNQLSPMRPRVYCKSFIPLQESAPMMLFAGGGVGKSYVSIRIALTFIQETGKKAVLWLTEDADGETRARYKEIITEFEDKPREFYDSRINFISSTSAFLTGMRDGNAELTEDFTDLRLQLFDYGLVVLDPLLHFQGCDENSNTHAGVLMNAMQDWCKEEQKIVLLLHHSTTTNNGGYKARGAREWVNGTRGVYFMRRVITDDGELDPSKTRSRVISLDKDNGIGRYFRDQMTGLQEKTFLIFPEDKEEGETDVPSGYVRWSVADHDNVKCATGFEQQTVPFETLHLRIKDGKSYSQFAFADGHRKSENNMGYSDVLILDFDDGMVLTDAEKKFKGLRTLIITTKSHKKDGKTDRFRVIIKLKTPLIVPPDDFKEIMSMMFEHLGSPDPATKDMARVYRASPDDAFHFYTNGIEFDWEPIYRIIKREKVKKSLTDNRRTKKFNRFLAQGAQDNTLPHDEVFITDKGNSVSFGSLRHTLSVGEKQQIQCRHGHGHNKGQGPQYNAAAFVMKSGKSDNVFYKCMGGKCEYEDVLWCED